MAYTREDKQRAMTVLASHAGNAGLTTQVLKEQHGINIAPATIRRWRNSDMREFYDSLLEGLGDQTASIINEVMETARLAAQAERLAIEKAHQQIAAGECKDPAKAARDLSHIKAMNVEKFLTLSGRPTQILEVSNPDDALAEMVRMGVFKPVEEGEVVDAEVVDAGELPPEVVALLSAGSQPDR